MKHKPVAQPLLKPYDDAAHFFATLQTDRCDWCLSPYLEIYHSGLCRHCYGIRSEKSRLAREVRERMERGLTWRRLASPLRRDCHVVGKMEDMVKAEGQSIAEHRRPEHSSMAIEDLLRYISCQLLPRKERELYYGCATTISGLFSPAQRAALIHLLSEAVDLHKRHNRKKRAKANSATLVEESQRLPTWLAEALRVNR